VGTGSDSPLLVIVLSVFLTVKIELIITCYYTIDVTRIINVFMLELQTLI